MEKKCSYIFYLCCRVFVLVFIVGSFSKIWVLVLIVKYCGFLFWLDLLSFVSFIFIWFLSLMFLVIFFIFLNWLMVNDKEVV